jgi:hypothetical protein
MSIRVFRDHTSRELAPRSSESLQATHCVRRKSAHARRIELRAQHISKISEVYISQFEHHRTCIICLLIVVSLYAFERSELKFWWRGQGSAIAMHGQYK